MKKHTFPFFIIITAVFSAFMLGLFIGRNQAGSVVYLSSLPTQPSHNISPTENVDSAQTDPTISYPININIATESELDQLPGIGPEIAGRIVAFRSSNGPFAAPEELLNVDGIGPGKLEAVLDLIITGGNNQ